jgi:hypothetical protein
MNYADSGLGGFYVLYDEAAEALEKELQQRGGEDDDNDGRGFGIGFSSGNRKKNKLSGKDLSGKAEWK